LDNRSRARAGAVIHRRDVPRIASGTPRVTVGNKFSAVFPSNDPAVFSRIGMRGSEYGHGGNQGIAGLHGTYCYRYPLGNTTSGMVAVH
jgi:hypothetical protein